MTLDRRHSTRQPPIASIAKFFRAVLRAIKTIIVRQADAPVDAPKRSDQRPRGGGRPRTYHRDRAASPAERQRRRSWRAKTKTSHETEFRESHETPHETPSLKKEEKKEGLAPPISKDWRPDPDGIRLGKEVFGDDYEAQLADHIDYCLKTDFRCRDHDANWRRRCRYFQRNPQLRLDLRPRARQFAVKDCEVIEPSGRRSNWRRRRKTISEACDDLIARAEAHEAAQARREPRKTMLDAFAELATKFELADRGSAEGGGDARAPASAEDKAKVQSKLDWFRGRGNKEASG